MPTLKKRTGSTTRRTPKDALQKLSDALKTRVANQSEKVQVLAALGFNKDYEPTEEEMAKLGIYALGVGIDCIVTALLMGDVQFKTGEGAVSAMVQAVKLRSDLVTKAGLNGQGITEDDLDDEQERVRKAVGEVVRFPKGKSAGNSRKRAN